MTIDNMKSKSTHSLSIRVESRYLGNRHAWAYCTDIICSTSRRTNRNGGMKINLQKISEAGYRVMGGGAGRESSSRQAAMIFHSISLMCEHIQSKY